jgi:ATP-dependent helicase HepA
MPTSLDEVNKRRIEVIYSEMGGLLNSEIRSLLKDYLELHLPKLGEDWWRLRVINELSIPQCRRIEEMGIDSLAGLDLAALLRVLLKNQYELSWKTEIPPSLKGTLRKVQEIRNRWAHATEDSPTLHEARKDLQTIYDLATALGASAVILKKIQAEQSGMEDQHPNADPLLEEEKREVTKTYEPEGLQVGTVISLRSAPDKTGAIVSVLEAESENRYSVFIDGAVREFFESQIIAQLSVDTGTPDHNTSIEEFSAALSAFQINGPSHTYLYSLNSARIDFVPYQFRPVLKFIKSDRPRLLIADSVGVGKTIEAGLIMKELQARQELESVLIICPRPLVTERKWLNEMKRFDEDFVQLDSRTLRHCINETDLEGVWPERFRKAIIPYSIIDETMLAGGRLGGRNVKGITEIDPPPHFDLLIVDEAHHIRNPETLRHQAVRFFTDNSNAALFLTATPIQLGSEDLFVLLNTLRPDFVIDRTVFNQMAEPNQHINEAIEFIRRAEPNWPEQVINSLDAAQSTDWGMRSMRADPVCISLAEHLENLSSPESEGSMERVSAMKSLEELHTFSSILNRTRRRDIGEFTVRTPLTISIDMTDSQRELHDSLLQCQAQILSYLRPGTSVSFMMSTLRRQAASCLYGLAPAIDNILSRRFDEMIDDVDGGSAELDLSDTETLGRLPEDVRSAITEVKSRAVALDPEDPKLDALRRVVAEKRSMDNHRMMVFSSFRHTLAYLHSALQEDGIRVGVIHGGIEDEERVALTHRFQLLGDDPDAIEVMLFSEVGSEGLDYQYCDCIVNYDLPWNPMRIEQRIGRIDRRGQKSEKVLIYNFVTPNTIDADIYERCLLRIGVFNKELGGSEEILGSLAKQIHKIGEDSELTSSERSEKLQQLADNQVRAVQEQAALEEQQAEILGINLPRERLLQDLEAATSEWLSLGAIKNLVEFYLSVQLEARESYFTGRGKEKQLRLNQDARAQLLNDYRQIGHQKSPTSRAWEKWLKGNDPLLKVTFDAEYANQERQVMLLSIQHPLVLQAARSMENQTLLPMNCEFAAFNLENVPEGVYPFRVYEWKHVGVREDSRIIAVCSNQELESQLLEVLPEARWEPSSNAKAGLSELENLHYQRWVQARGDHHEGVSRRVALSKQSLAASHDATVSHLADQFETATNEKIKRMRKSQIANRQIDHQSRMRELDESSERADIHTRCLAEGRIRIVPPPAE